MSERIRFGTDGVRGQAGAKPITYEGAVRVGRAALHLARELGGKRVVVGRDPRPSGPTLEDGVIAGVTGNGGEAILAGIVPTAAIAFAVDGGLADVGVQITASHNPAPDNGFKVVGARGRKLDDDGIAAFEAWLAEPIEETTATGRLRDQHKAVLQAWVDAAEGALPNRDALAGRAIAVDLAHGAATSCLDWLRTVPAAWFPMGTGEGTINRDVGSEHPKALIDLVRAQRCTAGIAVDGDGDRCLLIDETGARVPGDALTWLLATRMGAKHLVVTEMSNGALEGLLPGVTVHRVAVGDRNLREAMDARGWPLGAEESGHVLFHDLAGGDGLITGLTALCLLQEGETLSSALAPFVPIPRRTTKVRVGRRPPLEDVPALREAVDRAELRLGPDGRVFLRYSGTEPVLRILVEGRAEAVENVATTLALVAAEALR